MNFPQQCFWFDLQDTNNVFRARNNFRHFCNLGDIVFSADMTPIINRLITKIGTGFRSNSEHFSPQPPSDGYLYSPSRTRRIWQICPEPAFYWPVIISFYGASTLISLALRRYRFCRSFSGPLLGPRLLLTFYLIAFGVDGSCECRKRYDTESSYK